MTIGVALGVFGAAIAAGLGGCGSALGMKYAGEAAAGVLSEDPNKFGPCLVLQALPGTQGIYGLLYGFLVLIRINLFGGGMNLDITQGLMILGSALPIALAGYFSGVGQGRASAGAMGIIAKRPEDLAKAMIYPAMVETYAVLGLLMSILMLYRIQL